MEFWNFFYNKVLEILTIVNLKNNCNQRLRTWDIFLLKVAPIEVKSWLCHYARLISVFHTFFYIINHLSIICFYSVFNISNA